jgi:hypothetical protein
MLCPHSGRIFTAYKFHLSSVSGYYNNMCLASFSPTHKVHRALYLSIRGEFRHLSYTKFTNQIDLIFKVAKNNKHRVAQFIPVIYSCDRVCGLMVIVPGYRSRGPGSIPGATKFCLERGPLSLVSTIEELLERKSKRSRKLKGLRDPSR